MMMMMMIPALYQIYSQTGFGTKLVPVNIGKTGAN